MFPGLVQSSMRDDVSVSGKVGAHARSSLASATTAGLASSVGAKAGSTGRLSRGTGREARCGVVIYGNWPAAKLVQDAPE